jgi:hypothetical protein
MPVVDFSRWTFVRATPGGDVRSTYHLTADALEFDSDSLFDGGHLSVPWSAIVEAGTTTLDMPVGRGAPDLGRFVPAKLEWLIASRSNAVTKPFMSPLPAPPDRDALIASVRDRLGTRWAGENIPLADARKRFGMPSGGGLLKTVGMIVGFLALLVLLIILLGWLLTILMLPAGFALGAWLFRAGLSGLRDAIAVSNTPTARVGSAAIGLVELEGLAKTVHPSPAAVTGRPSVWWDVVVEAWSPDDDKRGGGTWQQLAARHGGTMDALEVEDPTGRVSVWLKDADLLLTEDSWQGGKDPPLPSTGAAFMEGLGFPWRGNLRVRETRLEVDASVYVLGTLDERRTISGHSEGGMVARIATLLRTGQWRNSLVRMLPRWLGQLVVVLFGFLGIVLGVGRGGERVKGSQDSAPPDISPDAVLVWKGRAGRPFIVSNGREAQALSRLRSRSLFRCAAGIGVLCYCTYQLFLLF